MHRFWFRLALAIGGTTVRELQERMSSREFSEWQAFYAIEPFGWLADNWGHAQTASLIANTHLPKNAKPYKQEDFLPKEKEMQTTDQMLQFAQAITIAMGGDVKI